MCSENEIHGHENEIYTRENEIYTRENEIHTRENEIHTRKSVNHGRENVKTWISAVKTWITAKHVWFTAAKTWITAVTWLRGYDCQNLENNITFLCIRHFYYYYYYYSSRLTCRTCGWLPWIGSGMNKVFWTHSLSKIKFKSASKLILRQDAPKPRKNIFQQKHSFSTKNNQNMLKLW